MTEYLLDSHAFIWNLLGDKKLSKTAKKIIENINYPVYVSVLSFWELSIKYSSGKLNLKSYTPEDFPIKARESGLDIIELNEEESASFFRLPKIEHKDPFDRMIIWQAICRGYTLITVDDSLDNYKHIGLKTVW